MASAYRDLLVWQKSMDLTVQIYKLTESYPKSEVYGLVSQMRRAAVSVPSNIAEGSARGTKKDFRQFVLIAKGSICELHTQLLLSQRLGFGDTEQLKAAAKLSVELRKMLNGLSSYLLNKSQASKLSHNS